MHLHDKAKRTVSGRSLTQLGDAVGDFNAFKTRSKRTNGAFSIFNKLGQILLSLLTLSRLDTFIANSEWVEILVNIWRFFNSDHRLCLLRDKDFSRTPKPFRFQLFWLNDEEILERINEWCNSDKTEGKPGLVLGKKLKSLMKNLKQWAKNKYGCSLWT